MYKKIFISKWGHFAIFLDSDHWGLSVNFDIDDSEDIYGAIPEQHIIEVRLLLLNIAIRF